MKISIKYSLPLVIFAIFTFYTLALLLYSRTFMVGDVRHTLNAFGNQMLQQSKAISRGIEERYTDKGRLEEFLLLQSKELGIKISLYGVSGNLVFSTDQKPAAGFMLPVKEIITVNGKAEYVAEIMYRIELRSLLGFKTGSDLVYFAIALLFIALFILVTYLHYFIVTPLTQLRKSFDRVNIRSKGAPLDSRRKDEIGDLYRNFENMVSKLEASYLQQSEIISSISHDLKTPLTSIMGYVERLSVANVKSEEKKQEYYHIIYKKAQDIEKLIEEFSDYVKNEIDCVRVNKETVKALDFLEGIYNEYKDELEAYEVQLEYEVDLPGETCLEVDRDKMGRVFANLVVNALKYADKPLKIKFVCRRLEENIFFSVEDNGKGIPEEELPKIFTKFYRVDKSRSREKGGSGLGLAICKSIIESHGGTVKAYNVDGGGLGISFLLPVEN